MTMLDPLSLVAMRFNGFKQGSSPSISEEFAKNEFSHIYLEQIVDTRHTHQQQYMQARRVAAASASARYGHRLSIYLSQIIGNQSTIVQDRVISYDENQKQIDDTVDNQVHSISFPPSLLIQLQLWFCSPPKRQTRPPGVDMRPKKNEQSLPRCTPVLQPRNSVSPSIKVRPAFSVIPYAAEKRHRDGRGDCLRIACLPIYSRHKALEMIGWRDSQAHEANPQRNV